MVTPISTGHFLYTKVGFAPAVTTELQKNQMHPKVDLVGNFIAAR